MPGVILLLPDFVKLFLQTRNLLYAVQRTDSKLFDNLVSGHLEPKLLSAVQIMLQPFSGLRVRSNVGWHSGEMDLLLYDSGTNTALHLQAKAPLPPHGARLVERLESRVREGLDQLRKFRDLTQGERDAIISKALGSKMTNVAVTDALLARSCFGTHAVRSEAGNVKLLTLPILSGALNDCVQPGSSSLPDILERCAANLHELVTGAKPQWAYKTITVERVELNIPLLHFDHSFVEVFRSQVWRGRGHVSI